MFIVGENVSYPAFTTAVAAVLYIVLGIVHPLIEGDTSTVSRLYRSYREW